MSSSADLPPAAAPLAELRSQIGRGAALWAREELEVGPDRWTARSGARSADYNVVLCHGPGSRPAEVIAEVLERGVPSLLMLAGEALGDAQACVAAGWGCVGAVPLMWRALGDLGAPDGEAGARLEPSGLADARALVGEVFGLAGDVEAVALPDDAVSAPDKAVWGVRDASGTLLSCLALVRVDDAVVVWSMATRTSARRRGLGGRLLLAALADEATRGATSCVLHASEAGVPLYRAIGFTELERWQLWSRPRWVMGRL